MCLALEVNARRQWAWQGASLARAEWRMDLSYGYYWGACALSKSLPRSLSYAVA